MVQTNEVDIRSFPLGDYETLYNNFEWNIPHQFKIGEAIIEVSFDN